MLAKQQAEDVMNKTPPKEARTHVTQKNRVRVKSANKAIIRDDGTNEKKSRMKTAEDVISRVIWDDGLVNDEFIIGYIDRFVGIVEKPFTAFSWEDLASVDYNTLAIPKHRIQYFKYRGVLVWDKINRIDHVFGSTGNLVTVLDICKEVFTDNKDHCLNELSDDEDDGIVINTGFNTDLDIAAADREYWGPKKRPTHFLAVRIIEPCVVERVSTAQKVCLDVDPLYESCVIPTERLHITLSCLGLDTQEQVDNAVAALSDLKKDMAIIQPQNIELEFSDIGNFFHNVLYAKVKENQELLDFHNYLNLFLRERGIEVRDVFDFVPHMTLIKLQRQLGRDVLHTRFLDPRLYTFLEEQHFGVAKLDNIQLCEMSEDRRDGFYVTPAVVNFT